MGSAASLDSELHAAQCSSDVDPCGVKSLLTSLKEAQDAVHKLKPALESYGHARHFHTARCEHESECPPPKSSEDVWQVQGRKLAAMLSADRGSNTSSDKNEDPKIATGEAKATEVQASASSKVMQMASPPKSKPHIPKLKLPAQKVCRLKPEEQDFTALTGGYPPIKILKAEFRGMRPRQLSELAEFLRRRANPDGTMMGWYIMSHPDCQQTQLELEHLNFYELAEWVTIPMTAPHGRSYAEAVSQEPSCQRPAWFISHSWGSSVFDFFAGVEKHVILRCLSDRCSYWICAFCNSQHELGLDVGGDPTECSVAKVIAHSRGMLLFLDAKVSPFTRLWCLFETFVSTGRTSGESVLLDMAAAGTGGVEIMTDGPLEVEEELFENPVACQREREKSFPLQLLQTALDVQVTQAETARESDKNHILSMLSGQSLEDHALLPKQTEAYDMVDNCLRATIALRLWPFHVKASMDVGCLTQALSKDVSRLVLDMPDACLEVQGRPRQQEDFDLLATGIRPLRKLLCLRMNFQNYEQLANISELTQSLAGMKGLRALTLNFNGCATLASLAELGNLLPTLTMLVELRMELAGCRHLSKIESLWKGWAVIGRLRVLCLNLQDCTTLTSVTTLARVVESLPHLKYLSLNFCGCLGLPQILRKRYSAEALGSDPRKQFLWEVKRCINAARAGVQL